MAEVNGPQGARPRPVRLPKAIALFTVAFVAVAASVSQAALADGGAGVRATIAAVTSAAGPDGQRPVGLVPVALAPVAVAAATPALAGNPTPTASSGACPANMVEVEGDYCPSLEQRCAKWMDKEGTTPRRCAEFAPSGKCQTKTVHKRFCVDTYEYPNQPGVEPVVMKTWHEARAACGAQGKRLCTDSEWTLSCEGKERNAYPYGAKRDATACNIDKPHPDVDERALASASPERRAAEVARLWQGEASGSRAQCVSTYGVHDMTGNVDEWVVNEGGKPFKSGLKGGYWGPVRDRCRAMTTAHNEDFQFYQIGFRCCGDAQER